jgi:hypothetical protein
VCAFTSALYRYAEDGAKDNKDWAREHKRDEVGGGPVQLLHPVVDP